jgi:hypothetical protein
MTDLDAAFEEAIRTVEDGIKKLRKAWDEIVDNVNFALKFLPGYLEGQIRKAMGDLTAEYDGADNWLADLLLERGSAGALRAAASSWNSDVATVAGTHVRQLSFGQLPSNGSWSGPAQIAYRSVVDLQTKVLGETRQLIDDLGSTLNDLADALKVFWCAIAVAVGALVMAMVAAGVATGTGVGIPAAIATALGAVVAFWSAVGTATVLYQNVLDANKGKLGRIAAANGADTGWPKATADLSDASVLDGDDSDWTPNL